MTIEDPVARLTAGLAEEERLARATVQWSQSWRDFTMDGELRDDENAGTIAMCLADEDRAHIARQDPKATLDRVEAIRKVIADARNPGTFDDYDSAAIDYTSFREGVEAATDLFVRTLASIYPEDTDESGESAT